MKGKSINSMAERNSGFTLVELIIVILLVAVLAVTAGPSIFGRSELREGVLEHSLINLLRTQQALAMQDTVRPCYGIEFTSSAVIALRCDRENSVANRIQLTDGIDLAVNARIAGDGRFYFNANGCPVASSHTRNELSCNQGAPIELQLTGQQTSYICIASQGYISQGRCHGS